jgi:AcrR family transcriptional regulator
MDTTAPPTRRDEILAVAAGLFRRQGFRATGVKQIIDAAGIAKGTFYSHFRSKDELGLLWLEALAEERARELEECMAPKRTARGRILALFDCLANRFDRKECRGCTFLNVVTELPEADHPMRRAVAAFKEAQIERLEAVLRAEAAYGPRAASLARVILLLMDAALIESQTFADPWPLELARREADRLLS